MNLKNNSTTLTTLFSCSSLEESTPLKSSNSERNTFLDESYSTLSEKSKQSDDLTQCQDDSGYSSILKSNLSLLNHSCYHPDQISYSNVDQKDAINVDTFIRDSSRDHQIKIDILGQLHSRSIFNCIDKILNCLSLKDYLRVPLVCKTWQKLWKDSKKLNKCRMKQLKKFKAKMSSKKENISCVNQKATTQSPIVTLFSFQTRTNDMQTNLVDEQPKATSTKLLHKLCSATSRKNLKRL